MILRPCIECGEPSEATRCDEHTTAELRPRDRVTRRNASRWKNLSRRLRAMQPWCSVTGCGNTDLTLDHIIDLQDGGAPYARHNLQVLCRSHNTMKSVNAKEFARIAGPLAVARVVATRGDGATQNRFSDYAKPKSPLHIERLSSVPEESP